MVKIGTLKSKLRWDFKPTYIMQLQSGHNKKIAHKNKMKKKGKHACEITHFQNTNSDSNIVIQINIYMCRPNKNKV